MLIVPFVSCRDTSCLVKIFTERILFSSKNDPAPILASAFQPEMVALPGSLFLIICQKSLVPVLQECGSENVFVYFLAG